MSTLAHAPNVFQNLNDRLLTSGTNKTVFGEPVTSGDIKVIPVARVAYGFGGGSGILSRGSAEPRGREGMGGGGGVWHSPSEWLKSRPTARIGYHSARRKECSGVCGGSIVGIGRAKVAVTSY